MFCVNCGSVMEDGARFCLNCGAEAKPATSLYEPVQQQTQQPVFQQPVHQLTQQPVQQQTAPAQSAFPLSSVQPIIPNQIPQYGGYTAVGQTTDRGPKPNRNIGLGVAAITLGCAGLICAIVLIVLSDLFSVTLLTIAGQFQLSAGLLLAGAGLILGVVGLILGITALAKSQKGNGHKVLCLSGIIISAAALIATVIVVFVLAVSTTTISNGSNSNTSVNENGSTSTTPETNNNNSDSSNNNSNNNNSDSNNNSSNSGDTNLDAITLSGDMTGQVGRAYATKWFTFTVNSLDTVSSYASITAASGDILVVANITITNTYSSAQPFGTFDWYVDDDSLANYLWPVSPVNTSMMPESYTLQSGQTVTYDVVIEIPKGLINPYFMYTEIDSSGNKFSTFRLPIGRAT